MFKFRSIIKSWLPLAVAITLLCGIIYTVTQQVYRQSANDPQIQIAEDTAAALANGTPLDSLVATYNKIDIATSLAPFVIVFDEEDQPIVSSASLDGDIPMPPAGVFDYVRKHKEDRITWQPRPGVRHATVIIHYEGQQRGFILVGRSLREVENRIGNLSLGILIGWVFTLFATFIITFAAELVYSGLNRL